MKQRIAWPLAIVVLCLAAALAAQGYVGPILRVAFIAWFMLLIPGLSVLHLLSLPAEPLPFLVMAIALSMVIDTILAMGMVLTQNYNPALGLLILIAISLISACIQLFRKSKLGTKKAPPKL